MAGAKQRRYKANLRERYRDDLVALRHRVRGQLDKGRVDEIGSRLAQYAADHRSRRGVGATRREALDAIGVIEELAPIPDGLPRLYHHTWQRAAAAELFFAARRRGWITYNQAPRSLDTGPRYAAQAA